jgi:hypothetical protein
MGETCSMLVKFINAYKIVVKNMKGEDLFEDVGLLGRIILKWI